MARLVGVWFLMGGLGFLAWAAYLTIHPDAANASAGDLPVKVIDGVAGIFLSIVGALLLTRRTYRADLGDHAILTDGSSSAGLNVPKIT